MVRVGPYVVIFTVSRDCIYKVSCLLCHVIVFIRYRVYYVTRWYL